MNNISTQDLQNAMMAWAFMLIAGPFCLAFFMRWLEKNDDRFGLAYFYGIVLVAVSLIAYAGIKLLRWIL